MFLTLLRRPQVAPEKRWHRIAYLVQHRPEHFSPAPFDLMAGPCQGAPMCNTAPRHENDTVAEEAGEGSIRMSQDRGGIQKRIIVGHSLRVKPKRQLGRAQERLLVGHAGLAGCDGEPS